MDDFKREQHKACGPGGPKCECCNDYYGKDKRKLNKIARTRVKRMIRKAAQMALCDINN